MNSTNSTPNFLPEPNLTPRQKRLVRESFESVRDYSDSVVLLFYGRLFELAPQVRGLFKIDIREQARKLMNTLTSLVDALDRFEELRRDLADLGRRHAEYKVEPAHYQVLVTALMWAFGQALDIEFDRETRAAWEQLLGAVSAVMIEGAAEVDPRPVEKG
ncbi:MAG TPA: globin domain-containing protein [Bryobacteraceae bacterium]|jgi:hemoglobin-like flavoprotein|nr:globin domain-containing protein [Bryobacteraceae bacterium]